MPSARGRLLLLEYESLLHDSARGSALSAALRFWHLPQVAAFNNTWRHHMSCGAASCAHDLQTSALLSELRREDPGWAQWKASRWPASNDTASGSVSKASARRQPPSDRCSRSQQLGSLATYERALNASRFGLFPSPPPSPPPSRLPAPRGRSERRAVRRHSQGRGVSLSNERIAWTLTGGVALVIIVMYSLEVCLSWVATHASHQL